VKHLVFVRGDDGRVRLAGWSNYAAVDAKFRANIKPTGAAVVYDDWWGLL